MITWFKSRTNTIHNGKVLEFHTLCTSFYIEVGNTRKNRVPIDNNKASGWRPQAKGRCLSDSNGCLSTASLCEMLRLMGWNNQRAPLGRPRQRSRFGLPSERNSARRRGKCVALFWLHRSLRRYADRGHKKSPEKTRDISKD